MPPEAVHVRPLITTPLLVHNMGGLTQCPSGHKYYQSLYVGEPGSDHYIGVCEEEPSCRTYHYPVAKNDPEVAGFVKMVLQICKPCQKGQHECMGFRWDDCNCPCRDKAYRGHEVTLEFAAGGILLQKYGIELPEYPEVPVSDDVLRGSHDLCLYQIEADRMRLRSLQLQYDNMPRIGMD